MKKYHSAALTGKRKLLPTTLLLLIWGMLILPSSASKLNLSREEYLQIGQRIWKNECAGTIEGLTSWNQGEEFMSLGIGHFIWYPRGKDYGFDESFPKFVQFAASRGYKLPPALLGKTPPCPWNSRQEFKNAFQSAEMKSLRTFLRDTVPLQAEFIAQRLETALPKMLETIPASSRADIEKKFYQVAATPGGMYALMDYVNFKGEGVKQTERYKGQGWGLLQVLEEMKPTRSPSAALDEFRRSAAAVLLRRIENSPPARGESRWRQGWVNRVNTYKN